MPDDEHVDDAIPELVDELLARLHLTAASGRVEIEYRDGRLTKLWRHEPFSRSALSRDKE